MCDTFIIDCKYCVWKEKCLFLLRIKQLEDNALAKRIYKEADINNWPGLATEAQAICEQIKIKDITKQETPKEDIKEAIFEEHHSNMMKQFESSKKLKDIQGDNFRQIQEYFKDKNIASSRLKFKIRSKIVEKIPGKFKIRYKYNEEGLNCSHCKVEFTQSHYEICPARASLREGRDMKSMDDLVVYFQRYLTQEKKK